VKSLPGCYFTPRVSELKNKRAETGFELYEFGKLVKGNL
jgi:hypothetical protein